MNVSKLLETVNSLAPLDCAFEEDFVGITVGSEDSKVDGLAVAIARTFTDSFTGINYLNTPTYILAEFLGALIAVYFIKKLIK